MFSRHGGCDSPITFKQMTVSLLIRGVVALFFAAILTQASGLSWDGYFEIVARYLLVDGVIAAFLGMFFLRESVSTRREREMVLGVVMFVDAGGRILTGAALFYWPGLSSFPVTAAVFIAIMAVCTAAGGIVEAWLTAREEIARHGRTREAPQFMAGPVALAALVSTAFGVAAIASSGSPDRVRLLVTGFIASSGIVSLAMGWSSHRQRGRRLLPAAR